MLPKFNDIKKSRSREETIIEAYRNIFNRTSIPEDGQYWTLCNDQVESNELTQLIDTDLIRRIDQFYGVDINKDLIEKNALHIPEANWFCGELYDVIVQNNGLFRPSILNVDLNCMTDRSIEICTMLMMHINRKAINNVMLILNVMINNPRARTIKSYIELNDKFIDKIVENKSFGYWFNKGNWHFYEKDCNNIYTYNGTGKYSKTIMSTLILWK